MKKFCIFALVLLMAFSLAACGRRNNTTPTTTATTPSTDMNILPDMDPTLDTNIPDPNVDTSMPMYTDGTDSTIDTRSNTATDGTFNSGRTNG